MNSKFPKWPFYSKDQIESATRVLETGNVNYWTGNQTTLFENEFSKYFGINYSIATSNGTSALTLAYMALDLKKDDEVITTPRTFIATTSAFVLLGAKPIFADVDIDSGAITAETIEPLINDKTKAISVVHLGGWPAEIEKIVKISKKYNIPLIEDCSQAHGAKINNSFVGNFGDIATWSFCQDKIISTGGEGGLVATNRKDLWEKMWSLKDHGKNFFKTKQKYKGNSSRFVHDNLGTNFRLTEFQSAIGRKQLEKLEDWIIIRKRNASILIERLNEFQLLRIPIPPSYIKSAWYKFYCFIEPNLLKPGWSRDKIVSEINDIGYPAFQGSCSEIYLEECFSDLTSIRKNRLTNAKMLGETSLMFLLHPTINENDMLEYSEAISKVIKNASL